MVVTPLAFSSTLIHRCSVVKASVSSHMGQQILSWVTGATTTASIKCRWQPVSLVSRNRELPTGAMLADFVLWMKYADAPATLRVLGAADTHRITTIATKGGTAIDAGPFDIKSIENAAGASHLLYLVLKRAA